jgi:hypothetical protein
MARVGGERLLQQLDAAPAIVVDHEHLGDPVQRVHPGTARRRWPAGSPSRARARSPVSPVTPAIRRWRTASAVRSPLASTRL